MSWRPIRSLSFVVVSLFALSLGQSTAHGLTVIPWETEHDWTVQVGDYRFGLEQWAIGDSERATDIYWGGGYTRTEWLAPTIVIVAAGALAATLAIGGLVFAAFARRKTTGSASPDS